MTMNGADPFPIRSEEELPTPCHGLDDEYDDEIVPRLRVVHHAVEPLSATTYRPAWQSPPTGAWRFQTRSSR